MRRKFARRTSGSAGRSGGVSEPKAKRRPGTLHRVRTSCRQATGRVRRSRPNERGSDRTVSRARRALAATRRAYGSDLRAFSSWLAASGVELDGVDTRVLADYVAELGRGQGRLAPASISRRLAAIRACLRFNYGAASVPDAALGPTQAAPASRRAEGGRDRGAAGSGRRQLPAGPS